MTRTATRCVHAGNHRDLSSGAVNTPIVHSTTYEYPQRSDGQKATHIYTRYDNPTTQAVERKLEALEQAQHALVFSSGLSAIHGLLQTLLKPGDGIVIQRGIYGGTQALLAEEFQARGVHVIEGHEVDIPDVPPGTKVVYMESMTNPLLRVANVEHWAEAAHDAGAVLVVDATFVTPLLQRPLELGADYVVHSATKYLNGHSDVTAGVVASNQDLSPVWRVRRNVGTILDPAAGSLLERGLKTLHVRMERQVANASYLAKELHQRGVHVLYPGLDRHPDARLARDVLKHPGAMLTLELPSLEAAVRFREQLRLVVPAASLGGVESLASLPLETSHAYASEEARKAQGIQDGLVRISVGIEAKEDLLEDLLQAGGWN